VQGKDEDAFPAPANKKSKTDAKDAPDLSVDTGYPHRMYLSKPMKALLLGFGVYTLLVLMFRYGRGGMAWDKSLLVALVAAPVALFWAWVRDHWNDRAREAGARWRRKRQN
jgi:hypothetical protein